MSFSANIVLNSGVQKGCGANHKILLTLIFIDHSSLTSLLMSPLLLSWTYYHDKINNSPNPRMLFKNVPPCFCPPPPLSFFTQNNLLDSNQSGFRSGQSTETALLSVVEALRLARADSKSSILILLDLSAAFDLVNLVNHQILLSTLLAIGTSGTPLQWFESDVSDRSFKVYWRCEVSKSQHLTTGVPQGSVLEPHLFYMASLGSVIQKHGFSYHC